MALPPVFGSTMSDLTASLESLVDLVFGVAALWVVAIVLMELFKRAAWAVACNEADAEIMAKVDQEYDGDFDRWNEEHPDEDSFFYEDENGDWYMDEYDIRKGRHL